VLVDDFFSSWIPADGTVLDFGCGFGEFINAVKAKHRIAIDARAEVVDRLDPEIEFHVADGTRVSALADHQVDVVFCSNLLEHLPDRAAVISLLREFHRLLKSHGRLLILGPNLRYTGAAYWDFFDHIIPFTHHSLAEALSTSGFDIEELLPRFLPYTTVGTRRVPLLLVRCYLRIPPVWKIMGAQFFAVARPRPRGR
jgi:SAM-dependent methyltransferase